MIWKCRSDLHRIIVLLLAQVMGALMMVGESVALTSGLDLKLNLVL
jgi:hypothetical protein